MSWSGAPQAVGVRVPRHGQLVPVGLHRGGGLRGAVRAGRQRRRARHAGLHHLVPEHRGALPEVSSTTPTRTFTVDFLNRTTYTVV